MSSRWRLVVGAGLLVLAGLLWAAWPIENRTEPEDAFTWAHDLEHKPLQEQVQSRHRLTHVLKWAFWKVGIFERSYSSLIALNFLCSVACLAMMLLATRRWGWEWRWCLLLVALTAGSYGFWRYSREAEVYFPPMFLALAGLAALPLRPGPGTWKRAALGGLCLAAAWHAHVGMAVVAVVAFPIAILVSHRDWRPLAAYLVATAATYLLLKTGLDAIAPAQASQAPPISLRPESFLKALAGLGQSLVASHAVFAIEPIAGRLEQLFAYRNLGEELWLARSLPWWSTWVWGAGIVTLTVIGLLLSAGLIRGLGRLLAKGASWFRGNREEAGSPELIAVLWLGCYGSMILAFEPGNPEMWLMGIPILWIVVVALLREGQASVFRVGALAIALFLCNFLNGIVPLSNPKGDLYRVRTESLPPTGSARFGVILRDRENYTRYLRYHIDEPVCNLALNGAKESEALIRELLGEGLDSIVFDGSVLEAPAYLDHHTNPMELRAWEARAATLFEGAEEQARGWWWIDASILLERMASSPEGGS